jgi:hypothetical protein
MKYFHAALLLAPLLFLGGHAIAYAQSDQFVPLTTLPGIKEAAAQNDLAPFLSELYKICIGLAAVLTVLQLMRAGVMYMGGDSITEKAEARRLIGTSLAGLLLVLSPVIVFSIINPKILDLNIGADQLKSNVGGATTVQTTPQTDNGNASLGGGQTAPTSKIDATGATNAACQPIQDGQIIQSNNYQQEQCCAHQSSATVTCQVLARNNSDLSQTEYCSCSKK